MPQEKVGFIPSSAPLDMSGQDVTEKKRSHSSEHASVLCGFAGFCVSVHVLRVVSCRL